MTYMSRWPRFVSHTCGVPMNCQGVVKYATQDLMEQTHTRTCNPHTCTTCTNVWGVTWFYEVSNVSASAHYTFPAYRLFRWSTRVHVLCWAVANATSTHSLIDITVKPGRFLFIFGQKVVRTDSYPEVLECYTSCCRGLVFSYPNRKLSVSVCACFGGFFTRLLTSEHLRKRITVTWRKNK